VDKKNVARALEEIATFQVLLGENPFKARAYSSAARTVERATGDLAALVETGELFKMKGIGKSLFEKIKELVETGRCAHLEELRSKVPPGLVEMISIPGFGPKRAAAVHKTLGIATVGELEYACKENRLVELDGFGRKSQDKVLAGIQFLKRHRGRFLLSEGLAEAEALLDVVERCDQTVRACIAGSCRRRKETVKDVDILAAVSESGPVMDAFTSAAGVESIVAKGQTKSSVVMASGIAADLRTVSEEQFPYALQHFTGSAEHNVAMRGRAQQKYGMKSNEYGLFKGEKFVRVADEAALYKKLGLAYIEPELRENMGEIEAAEKGKLPTLVTAGQMKGVLHCHTVASDGSNTLAELADASRKAGYEYIGIADHSQTAVYAGGLTEEEVVEQHRQIDGLNAKLAPFRILKGIESDILTDGALDYPDRVLKRFDFVIASVHTNFGLTRERMTKRIVEAMKAPWTCILGHPTGRLLLARDAYELDVEEIIRVAAELGVALEINANSHRLDLDWRQCRLAVEVGAKIAIGVDAHDVSGLQDMTYGVDVARKGWLGSADVLNTLSAEGFGEFCRARRGLMG